MNINRAELSGSVADDPVFSVTGDGREMISFRVAVSSSERRPDGAALGRSDEIRCIAYGERALALDRSLSRGTRLAIAGRLRRVLSRDEDGRRCESTYVIVDVADVLLPKRKSVIDSDVEFARLEGAFRDRDDGQG